MQETTSRDAIARQFEDLLRSVRAMKLRDSARGFPRSLEERMQELKILEDSRVLIQELCGYGPGGDVCPRCHGSGRVDED
jgi:hypothetical protein